MNAVFNRSAVNEFNSVYNKKLKHSTGLRYGQAFHRYLGLDLIAKTHTEYSDCFNKIYNAPDEEAKAMIAFMTESVN